MIANRRELPPLEDRRASDADGHDVLDPLGVAIVTVSSSRGRTVEMAPPDPSGDAIARILVEAGHVVTARTLVPDDYVGIKTAVSDCLDQPDVDIVVTTGGTGVTADDVTPDAVGGTLRPGTTRLWRSLSLAFLGRSGESDCLDPCDGRYRP